MKKSLLIAPVLMLGVLLALPAPQADARSWKEGRFFERVCNYLERREIRAWSRFDEDKSRSVHRVQNRINFQERIGCQPDDTIVGQLVERKQFGTLATALTEANLIDTLNSEGEFTVFAPTDAAFAKLGQETIDAVLADIDLLTNILTYHVVDPADVPFAVCSDVAVTLESAPMFNGDDVTVEVRDGALFINDSKVVVTDIQATNGIVHVIDTVLLP